MAIIKHSITFGGVNSADFGIYISGEGVWDAPERDVESVDVPGRNGTLLLDRGRWKNIEVTYPAFNAEPDLETFRANLDAFRNAIASQVGYQRLTDSFHLDEYRMATYVDGIEVKPIINNTASEFELVFNCKPQRYLTSGEVVRDITQSGTPEAVKNGYVKDGSGKRADIFADDHPEGASVEHTDSDKSCGDKRMEFTQCKSDRQEQVGVQHQYSCSVRHHLD